MDDVTDAAVEAKYEELWNKWAPSSECDSFGMFVIRRFLTDRQPKRVDADQIAKTGMSWDELVHAYFSLKQDSNARIAWLEKSYNEASDQNVAHVLDRDRLNARIAELEAELADWKTAEHSLSSAYILLRSKIPDALDPLYTAPGETLWPNTEAALDRLVAAAQSPTIRLGGGLTEAQEGDLDAIIYYYVSQGWPVYTQTERALKPTWSKALADAQSQSISRHRERVYATLRASATPKPDPVNWVAQATTMRAEGWADYDTDAIMAGLCEQIADLKAKVV